MNISPTSGFQGPVQFGDTSAAASSGSPPVDSAASSGGAQGVAGSDSASRGLSSGRGADYTGLQTAASYVQFTSGYVDQIKDILSQMHALAGQSKEGEGAAPASDGGEFSQLQEELRSIVGGSTGEIGGAAGGPTTGVTFDGSEVFGASLAGTPFDSGSPSALAVTPSQTNLRQGALGSLITQDGAGQFSLESSSPGAAATVSAALAQASSAGEDLGRAQATLDAAANEVSEDPGFPSPSPENASSASRLAAGSILGRWSAALAAHSGKSFQSALGLLQAG